MPCIRRDEKLDDLLWEERDLERLAAAAGREGTIIDDLEMERCSTGGGLEKMDDLEAEREGTTMC